MDTRKVLTAERLWALLIDWMLVSFMSSIVTKLPIPNVSTPFASWSEYGLIGIAIAVIYSGIMEGSRGATIGKEVLKLRVVNLNGNHISYATSFTRAICKFIPLGWLLMLFDENRALHDYIAKTRVIQV
jgi:uncharacterized RDD family membrane protein YckC